MTTRIGWLADKPNYVGGAELTAAEFRIAVPDGVEILDCPSGGEWPTCDAYVIHNCVTYPVEELERLVNRRVAKYNHDVGPHIQPDARAWLDEHAMQICCSPVQAEYMGIEDAILIPPAIDLSRFEDAAASMNGDRQGAVCIGSWRNFGKAPQKVAEWARENGEHVDYYGSGPFAPPGSAQIAYEAMPKVLARYERFVYLPIIVEPFGRLVAEAWAAGLEIVTNSLVGAAYWIQEKPEALETAAQAFWDVVLGD